MKDVEAMAPDLLDLLDSEREIAPAPADQSARMFDRLAASLPGVAPVPGPGGNSVPPATLATVGSGLGAKIVLSAVLLGVGAAGGAGVHAALTASPRAEVVATAVPVRIVVSIQTAEAPPPASVAPAPVADAPPPPSAAPSSDERGRGETQLKAERLVLEAARTALSRGDTDSALLSLRRHAREFPRGQLTEEREVMMVQVLKASGDDAAARERASTFKHSFPKSLMNDAVEQAAGSPKTQ